MRTGFLWASTIKIQGKYVGLVQSGNLYKKNSTSNEPCLKRGVLGESKNLAPPPKSQMIVSFAWFWLISYVMLNRYWYKIKSEQYTVKQAFYF
jgi:hypothetical protein